MQVQVCMQTAQLATSVAFNERRSSYILIWYCSRASSPMATAARNFTEHWLEARRTETIGITIELLQIKRALI